MANLNKLKKYHFLYKTTNLLNGKFYIGIHSTSNLKDGYLGSGTRLRRSIRKYGEENFKMEILQFFNDRQTLFEEEKKLVNNDLLKDPLCMNLKPGGTGGCYGEAAMKWSKAGTAKIKFLWANNPNFKKDVNIKTSIRNIELWKIGKFDSHFNNKYWVGKTHTDETKRKMSEVKKGKGTGKDNTQFGTMWITNGTENKKIKKEEIIPTKWKKGRILKK
jgi:group I intron endonuclease